MKNLLILTFIISCIFSCSTTKNVSNASNARGKDGSSFEKAIIIDKNNETEGVAAEYEWLRKNYPGYQNQGQSLVYNNDKPYDLLKIKTADGTSKSIYFDISKFFGKF
jgi:hypothetical protein